MDEILSAFIEDAGELLTAMESGLLRMEAGDATPETLNAVFRAAHTIKGDAGVVELHEIEAFTHVLENALDRLRKHELAITSDLIDLMLQGCDHIRALMLLPTAAERQAPTLTARGERIVDRLTRLATDEAPSESPPESPPGLSPSTAARANGDARPIEAHPLRVQADKLDRLIDSVGELIVSCASANAQAQRSGLSGLIEANALVSRQLEGLRELALKLRMVQIGETFGRFRRRVRDMARQMDREIELQVRGEDTELDKTVVEKIADPLMHLLRNALDHGIEPTALRRQRGKPACGRIELSAHHETGGIVIEVADDGAGLDEEKILAKAIERGVIDANDTLTQQEIFNLIFDPGFSTADKVTHLSGRGVGLDVVRSNVQALRGAIEVHSAKGAGTRFVIRLPLTMAIIDGFLVGIDDARYVIPLESVVECTEFQRPSDERNDFFTLRNEVLPCIGLRDLFACDTAPPARENLIVVRQGEQKACIVVDTLLGEFQTVIKPLSTLFRHLKGIAGATIIGSGEVALILDIPMLMRQAVDRESQRVERATATH